MAGSIIWETSLRMWHLIRALKRPQLGKECSATEVAAAAALPMHRLPIAFHPLLNYQRLKARAQTVTTSAQHRT